MQAVPQSTPLEGAAWRSVSAGRNGRRVRGGKGAGLLASPRWLLTLALAALCLPAVPHALGQQQGAGDTWYLYWINSDNPKNYAFVTDDSYEASDSFATVGSRVYDPVKGTETTLMELYDAESDRVATVSLTERNSRNEVIRKITERHPDAKLVSVGDPKSREYALLMLIKESSMNMKSKDDARQAFVAADSQMKARARQQPGGIEPSCWK
jgi:hypothetical protein